MLEVAFVTLFPEMVLHACGYSILGRAKEAGLVEFETSNPRDFAEDKHRTVDDTPYGGGPGMLLKPGVVAKAIQAIKPKKDAAIVLCEPSGKQFSQAEAKELSRKQQVVFVCGHYEGIDDRVRQLYATHVFSIGDYVLTGGELPALVIADAIVRLLPGALGSPESLEIDSHAEGLLSAPQFTRPEVFEGLAVPEVLTKGDHKAARKWKRAQSLKATKENRPDLFARAKLEKDDPDMLSS